MSLYFLVAILGYISFGNRKLLMYNVCSIIVLLQKKDNILYLHYPKMMSVFYFLRSGGQAFSWPQHRKPCEYYRHTFGASFRRPGEYYLFKIYPGAGRNILCYLHHTEQDETVKNIQRSFLNNAHYQNGKFWHAIYFNVWKYAIWAQRTREQD